MREMKVFRIIMIVALTMFMCASLFAASPKLNSTQEVTYNLQTEPETIDPAKSTGITEMTVELACFEGLMRIGPNDIPTYGVASKYTVSKDGLTYTFNLRKNAKWSNGDPVTAKDFVYAWQRALSPQLASEYAYQLYYIKNAEAYNSGKITDPNQLGAKAVDDYTLVVTLEAPCPYFLSIASFPTLFPVHRATVEAKPDKWATEPASYIGNGPFKLTNWVHQQKIEFAPNPNYWNKKIVKLKKISFFMVEEQSTALTMFESNQVDFLDELPNQELPRLEKEGILKYTPYLGTYFYRFNVTKPPFNDVKVRKALTLAINRKDIIKYVTKAGQTPALAYVPDGIPDAQKGKTFREIGGKFYDDADYAQAKKLLEEAGYPNGKGFPTVEILYNTSENHKVMAEAIQEMWKKNLGINVTLTNQEWKVYLDSQQNLNYQICRAGWIGDYVDPMTFVDMFVTGGGNNQTGWSNAQYDKAIDIAKNTGDQKVRMKAMHDAEKILMTEFPVCPIYFYTRPYVLKDWVKGLLRSSLGYIDFTQAYITAH
jgi:oligopeptide transport system substrate-binding protein